MSDDPWAVLSWQDRDALVVHLYPAIGRKHDIDPACWCHPERHEQTILGDPVVTLAHHPEP